MRKIYWWCTQINTQLDKYISDFVELLQMRGKFYTFKYYDITYAYQCYDKTQVVYDKEDKSLYIKDEIWVQSLVSHSNLVFTDLEKLSDIEEITNDTYFKFITR